MPNDENSSTDSPDVFIIPKTTAMNLKRNIKTFVLKKRYISGLEVGIWWSQPEQMSPRKTSLKNDASKKLPISKSKKFVSEVSNVKKRSSRLFLKTPHADL